MDFIAEQEIVYDVKYVSAEDIRKNFPKAYEMLNYMRIMEV